jgi:hypothetical protein
MRRGGIYPVGVVRLKAGLAACCYQQKLAATVLQFVDEVVESVAT